MTSSDQPLSNSPKDAETCYRCGSVREASNSLINHTIRCKRQENSTRHNDVRSTI